MILIIRGTQMHFRSIFKGVSTIRHFRNIGNIFGLEFESVLGGLAENHGHRCPGSQDAMVCCVHLTCIAESGHIC